MERQKPKIDVINLVLEECIIAYPVSSFIIGLYQQYQQRGWLTRKQLEDLHSKASKAKSILPERLAALEAIIRKMPNRYKTAVPVAQPTASVEDDSLQMATALLAKYPQHKRVLFLKARLDQQHPLTNTEKSELKKFCSVLKIEWK